MRIYNKSQDITLKNIALFLTLEEAEELRDSLNCIIKDKETKYTRHEHINDGDYTHEITISLYEGNGNRWLDPRIAKVLKEDK